MMLLRVNMRTALAALCIAVLVLVLYWTRCDLVHVPIPIHQTGLSERPVDSDGIPCSINGEYTIDCKKIQDEVYIPFSFIRKYFEIYGKLTVSDGVQKLEWSHSYSKVYHPKKKYDPTGTFMNFENYNVEVRDRVKCISGINEVPISTQWEPRGFFYPTQIAQYGLAHYSKNITEPEPTVTVIDDGDSRLGNWMTSDGAAATREYDPTLKKNVLSFSTKDSLSSQVWLDLNISQEFVMSMDLLLKSNSSVMIELQSKDKKECIYLHYVTTLDHIYAHDQHVYHGIGTEGGWRKLTRDLVIDMQKGWALLGRPKKKSPRNKFKVCRVSMRGSGRVAGAEWLSSAHGAAWMSAAKWLRTRQAARGGWPVSVRRRLAAPLHDLQPGWHSAMSQGHAISLLARTYHRTGDKGYLEAAKKALYIFDVPSSEGGVKAMWMDKYVWYEEYPTTPPLFVLNGFIYALLGLYDLQAVVGGEGGEGGEVGERAAQMFADGMRSLKRLLPLFDTGAGSLYDLRHYTLGASPNRARWDYHATHVTQLHLLAALGPRPDPQLAATAARWEGYMRGRRAHHN